MNVTVRGTASAFPRVTEAQLRESLSIVHGNLHDAGTNLFTVVRNEIFFLPAFFDHYRRLGVEQFVILDDGSTDGTAGFLAAQRDCVSLRSSFAYKDHIELEAEDRSVGRERAGIALKKAMAQKYLMGKFALYVDADEFLILPRSFGDLPALIADCIAAGVDCVAASLIDFYPPTLEGLSAGPSAGSFNELVATYSCFDAVPIVQLSAGRQPKKAGLSASGRLFRQCGIREPRGLLSWMPQWAAEALPFPEPRSPWLKTPLIHFTEKVWLDGSHKANVPPAFDRLLALVHFKFTADFKRRIDAAVRQRTHFRSSQTYRYYRQLLQRIEERGGALSGPKTETYSGPAGFVSAGLAFWPKSSVQD
jgi:hypothetical protein